jgi:hypothetical protein
MVKPISLRLRRASIIAKARATVARVNEEVRVRRSTKLFAFKALHYARQAYDYEEETSFRSMTQNEQKRWRERRKLVEAELKRIAETA